MRVYGRLPADEFGNRPWVVVQTDAGGFDDYVHATALVQCLKLNLGESPFYANFGIPAKAALLTQVQPDHAAAFIQSSYARFFASLVISKRPLSYPPVPTYDVSIVRNDGSALSTQVAL